MLERSSYEPDGNGPETVTLGPFRSPDVAERRAAVVRCLVCSNEGRDGVAGPDNALDVRVKDLQPGRSSAHHALDVLYGAAA